MIGSLAQILRLPLTRQFFEFTCPTPFGPYAKIQRHPRTVMIKGQRQVSEVAIPTGPQRTPKQPTETLHHLKTWDDER
jgi:hypothetical protein